MKMNKLFYSILAASALVVLPAQAITINSGAIDVGQIDTFIESGIVSGNNPTDELAWATGILNDHADYGNGSGDYQLEFTFKDDAGTTNWTSTDTNGVYSYDLGEATNTQTESGVAAGEVDASDSNFFILKLGNGGNNITDSHYLFENLDEARYAVVNFEDPNLDFTLTAVQAFGRISHTTGSTGEDQNNPGPGNPEVPEPSTYAMFGMAFGILGFVGYRNRKSKS